MSQSLEVLPLISWRKLILTKDGISLSGGFEWELGVDGA